MDKLYYIRLSDKPIRFDAVSQLTSVFFDDSNKQIFAVRSGGSTGVTVKGPTEDYKLSFCMKDRGKIHSIKFSPDNRILAIQRCDSSIEFICFAPENDQPQQEPIIEKVKSRIFGFVWVDEKECALICNTGVEIYAVLPEKQQVRSIKSLSMSIKWFAWCAATNIALVCSAENNALIPVIIKKKSITKLSKLDTSHLDAEIQESKVTLCQIYDTMTVLVLHAASNGMEVEVHMLNGPGLTPRKCHVLRLDLTGRFAINIIDNLIVVHHQTSATSLLFDIALNGVQVIDDVSYHEPVTEKRSIEPFFLKIPSLSPEGHTLQCQLYSMNWVLFQPNIVIDAKIGCMWYLHLNLDAFCELIPDDNKLIEFLLHRCNGKATVLKTLKRLVSERWHGDLPQIRQIFDKVNAMYGIWIQLNLQNQIAQPSTNKPVYEKPLQPKVIVEQSDMLSNVLQSSCSETLLLTYLNSLNNHKIAAQEGLSKAIIDVLIAAGKFETLKRLVNNSLILESKPIACYLLSHANANDIVSQLALDMLTKIKATDVITELLLSKGRVLDALHIAKSTKSGLNQMRKFLDAALNTKDDFIVHSTLKYFQLRKKDLSDEKCKEVLEQFKNKTTIE